MDNKINLLMSVDDNFFKPFLVAFYSIRANTTSRIRLFFAGSLTNYQIEEIKKIDNNIELIILSENREEFKALRGAKNTSIYPICSLYRIVCPFIVDKIEKLLWIDADVVVAKNIETIFKYDLKGNAIGAIADTTNRVKNLKKIKGHRINKYFFSGLLLFDVKKIQQNYSLELFEKAISDINSDTSFPDQDILNIVYANDVEYIPDKYNQKLVWNQLHDTKIDDKKYIIYHFAGDVKPWQKEFYNYKNNHIYWKYGKKIYSLKYRFLLSIKSRLFFAKKTLLRLLKLS